MDTSQNSAPPGSELGIVTITHVSDVLEYFLHPAKVTLLLEMAEDSDDNVVPLNRLYIYIVYLEGDEVKTVELEARHYRLVIREEVVAAL